MSYQEQRHLLYFVSSFLIYGGYAGYVWNLEQAGRIDDTNWGRVILLLIPIHIGINIVLEIGFTIGQIIVTRRDVPDLTDELDRNIELRALRNAYYAFLVGFLAAIASVAIEMDIAVMFNGFVGAFFLAEIAFSGTHLWLYRRGF